MTTDTTELARHMPALMSIAEAARQTGVSESTLRRCGHATQTTDHGWPPLLTKRLPDGRLRVTAAALAEWISTLPDA